MGRCSICFFLILFVFHGLEANAQQAIDSSGRINKISLVTPGMKVEMPVARPAFSINGAAAGTMNINQPLKNVPANFYYNNLGFFCSKELQVEKALKIPLKFRLGSVVYTDYMEGKNKP